MDELIEVHSWEFKEPNRMALEENVDERFVPTEIIADIFVNGKNLIHYLYRIKNERFLYEEVVGATVSSLLSELRYEPGRVKTVWLYDCSLCYRCYPIETDAYFFSQFVVWRYFHFPYRVKKTVLVFPKEVYLKGYKTLEKLASEVGIDPSDLKEVKVDLKTLKRIERFELRLIEVLKPPPIEEAEGSPLQLVKSFKNLVRDCLFELGFRGRDEERLKPAVRFLKLYDPDSLESILKLVENPPRNGLFFSSLENLQTLMEKALKRCKELLSRKSSGN